MLYPENIHNKYNFVLLLLWWQRHLNLIEFPKAIAIYQCAFLLIKWVIFASNLHLCFKKVCCYSYHLQNKYKKRVVTAVSHNICTKKKHLKAPQQLLNRLWRFENVPNLTIMSPKSFTKTIHNFCLTTNNSDPSPHVHNLESFLTGTFSFETMSKKIHQNCLFST